MNATGRLHQCCCLMQNTYDFVKVEVQAERCPEVLTTYAIHSYDTTLQPFILSIITVCSKVVGGFTQGGWCGVGVIACLDSFASPTNVFLSTISVDLAPM